MSSRTLPLSKGDIGGGLKKVLILDFKNIDQNPDYQYLEDSITDAVRKNLKEKFDFKEMAKQDWQKIAQDNYFLWPEDNYFRAFALTIGALARQDIAIGGYYQAVVETKGKQQGQLVIKAHVYVLNIGDKKVVTEFDVIMPADSSLFTTIEELAERVVAEAKSVLPNKGEGLHRGVIAEAEEIISPHELGFLVGVGFLATPIRFVSNYTSEVALFAKDFPAPVSLSFFYVYYDFGDSLAGRIIPPSYAKYAKNLQLYLSGGLQFSSHNFSVASETKKIRASLTDIFVAADLGYEFEWNRFTLTPLLGLGFSFAATTLDYTPLSLLPLNEEGAEQHEAKIGISAPFAEGGLRLGYRLTNKLSLSVTAFHRQNFYFGKTVGQTFATGGIGLRI